MTKSIILNGIIALIQLLKFKSLKSNLGSPGSRFVHRD